MCPLLHSRSGLRPWPSVPGPLLPLGTTVQDTKAVGMLQVCREPLSPVWMAVVSRLDLLGSPPHACRSCSNWEFACDGHSLSVSIHCWGNKLRKQKQPAKVTMLMRASAALKPGLWVTKFCFVVLVTFGAMGPNGWGQTSQGM